MADIQSPEPVEPEPVEPTRSTPVPLAIDATTRVAILAGGGDLPLLIADSVKRRGGQVHIVAIEREAGASVERFPHTWVNLAQASRILRALKGKAPWPATNVMVIAGTVTRPDLLSLRPDVGLLRIMFDFAAFITAGGDDALLTKGIRLFERRGLTVVGVQDVAPELLIGNGVLGRHAPDAAALFDLDRARDVLEALGDFDVGQGAIVEAGRVLAIEGVEGTDRMLARVKGLGTCVRGVLLKSPKPRQELRVDLPTIGAMTIINAKDAGLRGVAVIAGRSIGVQRATMIETADHHGVFLTGLPHHPASPAPSPPRLLIDTLGRHPARLGDLADAERGAHAVLRLEPFATGQTAAVVRGHVLGVSATETIVEFIARQHRMAQWGLARFNRRRGAIVVRALPADSGHDAAEIVRLTADAGFAALAFVVGARGHAEPFRAASMAADRAGVALISLRLDEQSLPSVS